MRTLASVALVMSALACSGGGSPPPAPGIDSFTSEKSILTNGTATALTVVFHDGDGVIDQGVGAVLSGAHVMVSPASDTTYTLTVTNAAGASVTKKAAVRVVAAPAIVSFAAEKAIITAGSATVLLPVFSGGDGVIVQGVGAVESGARVQVRPASDTTYTLTVTNAAGDFLSATLAVRVVAAPVIASFVATPAQVTAGGSASLVAVFDNGAGQIAGLGAVASGVAIGTGVLTASRTFTLTVTNEAGDFVTASAAVTVIAAPPSGTVTLLRRGIGGALEPVAGVAIHRSDAATGAFVETRTTGADGVADFGDPGGARRTLSLAGSGRRVSVVSFVDVPPGAITLRLDRMPGFREVLRTFHGSVTPAKWSSAIVLPSGMTEVETGGRTVSITRGDLQSDGAVTMLGRNGGGLEGGNLTCGALVDGPLPQEGSAVQVPASQDPFGVQYTADEKLRVTLSALRKDVLFSDGDNQGYFAPGGVGSCLSVLPAPDLFIAAGSTQKETARTQEGWVVIDTALAREAVRVVQGPAAPAQVAFALPSFALTAFSYRDAVFHVSHDATAGAVQLVSALVETDALEWHVFAPASRAANLGLPAVPGVLAPAWADGTAASAKVSAVEGAADFDALWEQARTAGSIEAGLALHAGFASAAGEVSRFTLGGGITLEGDFWLYGRVTSADGRLNCGSTCSAGWSAGTTVQLHAQPNPGALFNGWGTCGWGNSADVSVDITDATIHCTPSFGAGPGNPSSLSVIVQGGPAWVHSAEGLISCGVDAEGNLLTACTAMYSPGFGVILTEFPSGSEPYDLLWSGDCQGAANVTSVFMDGPKTCTLTLTHR